jgi:outer membrane biosynthesis protein TonB
MTMVNFRSYVAKTQTGHHGGLRRGSAAAALGAVLALTAGIPAAHAALGGSLGASAAPLANGPLSLGLEDVLDGIVSPAPQQTPAPQPEPTDGPDSAEPAPGGPPPQPPAQGSSLPSESAQQPAAPRPAATDPESPAVDPEPAGGIAPAQQPADDSAAPAAAVATPAPSEAAHTSSPVVSGSAHSASTSMWSASTVDSAAPSPLLGWGICLVGLSLFAGAAAVRLSRA